MLHRARTHRLLERRGEVTKVVGVLVESEGPVVALGELCSIKPRAGGAEVLAEVVGFREEKILLMPLKHPAGLFPGSEVRALNSGLRIPVGEQLKGRVINAFGEPLDSRGPIFTRNFAENDSRPPHPLKRQRITSQLTTGIKAIDTFMPCGEGQRLGIFAGSGVGKSTLLGMMASHASADVNVIALVGERGREVREFLERDLDEQARARSVIVVATSDEPALARLKGAFTAMTIAEAFRDEGKSVLLMMDSVTRFALAQREIGLAAGEPPTTRGYTPSVFALLPQLLERAGAGEVGSITGFFTVLVEGDDMNEPVSDAVRSILDGHIVLSRNLATQNHYPAIDVLESVSRLNRELTSVPRQALAAEARELLAIYRKNQDLINIGAYAHGSNALVDRALKLYPAITAFLRQGVSEMSLLESSWEELKKVIAV